jgi:hypothetical protein
MVAGRHPAFKVALVPRLLLDWQSFGVSSANASPYTSETIGNVLLRRLATACFAKGFSWISCPQNSTRLFTVIEQVIQILPAVWDLNTPLP